MTPENQNQLIIELRRDEGVRYSPYKDTKGVPTVGVGHNLQASPLPTGWAYPLTDAQVNTLLTMDLNRVYSDLDRNLSWWHDLNDVRQRALCNLCFNLGISRLLGFRNALVSMRQGKFQSAADEVLSSKWASDVGMLRSTRIANQIRNGR